MDNQPPDNKQEGSPVVIESANTSPKPGAQKTGPGLALWLLTLVIAVAGVGLGAFLWQGDTAQQQSLQQSQADIAGAIQRVDTHADNARNLQRQFDQQQADSRQQQQQLLQRIDNLQQQLSSQQKRLQSLSTTDRNDWLLAEAEYLMRLANQRLLMGKEVNGALALLQSADAIIKELDDSALYPVRQALANDMAGLRAAVNIDIEGHYLQLAALAQQAEQLQLIKLPELTISAPQEPKVETWQQRLAVGFQAALDKLSSYIQISRRDEVYRPLLAPEYEAAVRQNVRLMFEQAQMASLAGKQKLYEDSLSKAHHWLTTYYTLDKVSTDAVIAQLDSLQQQQIEIRLPDISSSLRALKNYIETIHQVKPVQPAEPSEESA
ncbi:uroporphyrinogen-III C-methyltransferase [Oceanicoccus sagamiensis]|uniref:Heme biosynthesis operon protein HemX n=1 Tax=Oceanicoccus sagamiensis TaxID=716816 RepID=A0A1X9NJI7_9GAMM|nr:uroporphyrinogen-III C-methyltransferase [Oceanicoccus sagamiensis]ARN74153.1 hypothetical protein BST96_08485 [Oceanicoccus sagamiensis]